MNAMDAPTLQRPIAQPPRARGEVVVSARADGGVTRLRDLRQQGSLKALFPRGAEPALDVVTLNTAGGLTSGDRMRLEARAEAGAHLRLTTQAAERAYRAATEPAAQAEAGAHLRLTTQAAERAYRAATEPAAQVESRLVAGDGARIDWLPQETILFDGARLERRLQVDLAEDATALLVEPVLWGRLARGEEVREGRLLDRWEVRRGGRLVFADALRLDGDMAATLDRAGVAGGARAMASVLFVGRAAETHLGPARALLSGSGGASLIEDGVLFARALAADGFALRKVLVPLICRLTGDALPKVWTL